MENLLTDRKFWVDYWESKKGLSTIIPSNYLFSNELAKIIKDMGVQSAIELGGFPGYYAVFLKKYFKLEVTLLDYFVHEPVTNELLAANGLKPSDIEIVETDLFNYTPRQQFDLVLSCGLIEHFKDTADIINRHIAFVKPGGTLFITLPNFKAVNGWFQKKYDKENYDKHNIDCMNPQFLAAICKEAGLEVIQSRYFGRFSIWLENEQQKSMVTKLLKKTIWIAGKLLTKVIPFDSKQLSPYLILEARKLD
ncbi:MAG: methyltransferase domain-containing protein [Pedobacter sp.]|nr:methyltransferase domain-containing protein [Pedobacter sp.]